MWWFNWNEVPFLSPLPFSFPTPELEGRSNLTSLDIQIKKLRDSALATIRDGARRMREEATEIRDTLTDIESWADKLKTLAEEVQTTWLRVPQLKKLSLLLWLVALSQPEPAAATTTAKKNRTFTIINRQWVFYSQMHSLPLFLTCFCRHCL